MAGLLRARVNAQVVKAAAAQIEDEIGQLERRRADLEWLAGAAGPYQQETILDERITERLPSMTLAEQRDLLALLEVRLTVTEEGYHLTGVLRELEIPVEPGPTETKVLHSHGPPARAG